MKEIERARTSLLKCIKIELDGMRVHDINNIGAYMLFCMGKEEMRIGELQPRGYYLGSNVSYNVREMTRDGYLEQRRSDHDRRNIFVRLTDKGLQLYEKFDARFKEHAVQIEEEIEVSPAELAQTAETLERLNQFVTRLPRAAPHYE